MTLEHKTMATFEYRLLCDECGDKSAAFSIDEPFYDSVLMKALMYQFNEITLPSHKNHTWSFKELRLKRDVPRG